MTPILSVTLAPPRTTTSGRSGDSTDRGQLGHLALEQEPGVAGQQVRDALGGGVGAVGGAEGVVDVEVGERGERLGELRVVLGLARLEADVLEQQHVAGLEPVGHRLDLGADDRRRQLHLGAEQLAEPLADRRHRERRVDLPFGRPRCETRTTRAPRSRSSSIVGSAARIRVSSATWPSSSGTLKSARTRTRLPVDVGVADARLGEAQRAPTARRRRLRGPCRRARRSGSSSPTRCRTRRPP